MKNTAPNKAKFVPLCRLIILCAGLFTAFTARTASLQLVTNDWGTNGVSTNLSMYVYVPDHVATNPPILVLLHYWGGTASSVFGQASAGGIVAAADQYGFIMVVPQRSSDCWDYSSAQALTRDGGGETHGIARMVRYAITNYQANANRVYVTGDSCGGMMTEAMLAVYPDIFKAGVAYAGVPVGGQWTPVTHTAQEWGNLARAPYPGYTGQRPRVQLWHGTADALVNYSNLVEATMQWGNVLGVSTNPTMTTTVTIPGVTNQWTHQIWKNTNGATLLDAWSDIGGDHGPSDSLFKARYVIPFLGLDQVGPVDPVAYGQRARPHLNAARTTFVADNGQPLRGPFTSTEWTGAVSYDEIAAMKNLGFNAIHLYGESFDSSYPTNGSTAPGYALSRIDSIVQSTRDLGMYLVLTIGNGANNGKYNAAYITNFWALYGARYANETHVLFEVQNEPVAWGPPYSSPSANPPGALNMEIAAYNTIRSVAPNTPILLFSYSVWGGSGGANNALTDIHAFNQSVFGTQNATWTNLAVGFHGYAGAADTQIAASNTIQAGYPCFMTEFGGNAYGTGLGCLDVELTSALERLGVSWLTFQHFDSKDVGSDVTYSPSYKDRVNNSGLGWLPDYGNWPAVRSVYGNNNFPWTTADVNNNVLGGTLRIEAENFDNGGKGVAYYNTNSANPGGQYRTSETVGISTTSDTGGGYNVSGTTAGDWLEYTMKISAAGTYNIRLRVAGTSAGSVQLIANATDLVGQWTLPNTGGGQVWTTVTRTAFLAAGQQKLRLNVLAGGFNLNWIELTPVTNGPIANGTYKLVNAASALTLSLDTNSTVIATNSSSSSYQQWNLQHIGGGEYLVKSVGNGGYWSTWMAPLHTVGYQNGYYIFQPTKGNFYQFFTAGGGECFQPSSGNLSANLTETAYSGIASQQWAVSPLSAPVFPVGLSAAANSPTQIVLTWNAVSGAMSYNVKRSTTSGGPYTVLAAGVATTNYTDTAASGVKFYYVVSAVSAGGESSDSLEASVNPPYPWAASDVGSVGLTGSVSFNSGVFSVAGSGDDIWNSADAFRFVYLTNSGDCTVVARVTGVQNSDGWAKAGVMIRANLNANSANAFIAVTPGNGVTWQTRSTAGAATGNSAAGGLTAPYWVKLVRSGNTFTGYRSSDGTNWTQAGSTTITMGTTVYIGLAVTAHNNSSLCTATFDNVTFPNWPNWTAPAAPASLAATVTNGQPTLTWPAASNATAYNVKRATVDGGPYRLIGNVTTTNYTDSSLSNGVAYYYVVSALNIAGESANSTQASVPAQYFTPSGLSVTPIAATQLRLVWNAFTNATSYNVKRSAVSGGSYTVIATGIVVTNYTDTIAAGMKYFYVVSAVVGAAESPNSLEATFRLPYPWQTLDVGTVGFAGDAFSSNGVFTVIGSGDDIWNTADAFRFVYVTNSGDCSITARVSAIPNTDVWAKSGVMIRETLNANSANAYIAVTPGNGVTWQTRATAGATTGNSAAGGLTAPYWVRLVRSGNTFTAYRSPDGITWTQAGSATISMATTVYVGLAVTAHNNSSLGTATFDNVTAPGWTSSMPPVAPAGLAGTGGYSQAVLTWLSSSTATSYNVKRSTNNGGPYSIVANVTTTNCTDTGLNNGTTYYYVVSALNPAGESADSIQASVVPQSFIPTGLAAAAVSSSQINLLWNGSASASSYNLKRSTTNGGPYLTIASGVTATNYQDSGLDGGTVYYYVVSAVVSGNETTNSAPASAATFSPTLGSLVHRYSFSENGGTTTTDSVGGPVWSGMLPNGGTLAGGQLTLSPASQQYANLPAGALGSLSNFTIMAWVNLNSVSDWSRIFDFWNNLTTHLFLTPQNGVSGTMRFEIMNSGTAQQINCNATMSTGVLHQVVVTLSGTNGVLYLDGVALGTNASMTINPSSFGGTVNNYLGKSEYSNPYMDGALDEFRIYNTGLSAQEIAATYALGAGQLLSTNNPVVSAALTGTNLTFSWPVANAGFRLQSCTNLMSGSWQDVTSSDAQIVGNQWQVILSPSANTDGCFYRLVK